MSDEPITTQKDTAPDPREPAASLPSDAGARHTRGAAHALAVGLALGGLGLSAYLLWHTAGGTPLAGCGEEAGCGQVLTTRWSRWLGMPVSLPAVVVYALTLLGLLFVRPGFSPPIQRLGWAVLLPCAVILACSAAWFLALQWLELHSFCGYCLATHTCGLLLAGLILAVAPVWRPSAPPGSVPLLRPLAAVGLMGLGLLGPGLLIGGQLLLPGSAGMQVTDTPADGPDRRPAEKGRVALDAHGDNTLGIDERPLLGSPKADRILVELFDYTCPHCRQTHVYLRKLRRRYGNQLALLLVCVPLNAECNSYFHGQPHPTAREACIYARLALAVWNAKPSAFEDYHDWLLEMIPIPTPAEARKRAERIVGADVLARQLKSPRLQQQLEENTRLYSSLGTGVLPKLIHRSFRIEGQSPNVDRLAEELERRLDIHPLQP